MTDDDIRFGVDESCHKAIPKKLRKNEPIWSEELGRNAITEHLIVLLNDALPFKPPPYRAGPQTRELEKFQVEKQLKARVIDPGISEWAALLLFDANKNEKRVFCCPSLGKRVCNSRYLLPITTMGECIDSLGKAEIFSTLDEYSGYWPMNIHVVDCPKDAFFLSR